jgi:hypothetical protein
MRQIAKINNAASGYAIVDKSTIALIGLAMLVFGLAQFSSINSNPEILQNLTSQGYAGTAIYYAPVFYPTYVFAVVGIALMFFFAGDAR